MSKTVKLATAFLAFATLTGGAVLAQGMHGDRPDRGDRPEMHLDRMDTDDSGDLSFEEFSNALGGVVTTADANGDGQVTVEELAEAILHQRAERQARRMIERFDVDGDGVLSLAEYEKQQQKHFALLDRNDDGVIQREELRHAHSGGLHHGHGPRRHHGR